MATREEGRTFAGRLAKVIAAHEVEYDQSRYLGDFVSHKQGYDCSTPYCIAGWTSCMAADPEWDGKGPPPTWHLEVGTYADGTKMFFSECLIKHAREALALTKEEAKRAFSTWTVPCTANHPLGVLCDDHDYRREPSVEEAVAMLETYQDTGVVEWTSLEEGP